MRASNIIAGCISYILSKNQTFQNVSNTEELRRAAMLKKESKNVLYKEIDLIRLLSLYQSTAKGFL